MKHKAKRISNKVRKIREDTLFNLLNKLPQQCVSCVFNANCPQIEATNDAIDCNNYKMSYSLNEIIEMLNEQNVDLRRLCDNYDLKFEYMMKFLKGKELLPFKYYSVIMDRLIEKEEFLEYEDRFTNVNDDKNNENKLENNTLKSEVMNK